MMSKFIRLLKHRFKQKGKTKYLAINTRYRSTDSFYIDGYFRTEEFSNKVALDAFLKNDVAKSDLPNWKVYIELDNEVGEVANNG